MKHNQLARTGFKEENTDSNRTALAVKGLHNSEQPKGNIVLDRPSV